MPELVTVRRRVLGRERYAPAGTLTCVAPAPYAVSSSPYHRRTALRFAFELALAARRSRVIAVFLRVRFDDHRVTVVRIAADQPDQASLEDLGDQGRGWFFGGFDPGRAGLGTRFVVSAEVELPEGLVTVAGATRVDVSVARGHRRPRMEHATTPVPVTFALSLPAFPTASAVRLCFAADIERFSRFRVPEAGRVQDLFLRVLADAREHAGIDLAEDSAQASGDGHFAVFPPALDESQVIPLLAEGLASALEQVNAGRAAGDRIRLRTALDRGHVAWGANGWVGNSPIAVHRLLDSPAARQALTEHSEADLVLIVSEVVFWDVVAHDYPGLPSKAFRRVLVDLPAKGFAEPAWVYAPPRPGGGERVPDSPRVSA